MIRLSPSSSSSSELSASYPPLSGGSGGSSGGPGGDELRTSDPRLKWNWSESEVSDSETSSRPWS